MVPKQKLEKNLLKQLSMQSYEIVNVKDEEKQSYSDKDIDLSKIHYGKF